MPLSAKEVSVTVKKVPILRQVSLEVTPPEILGVLGPSGAGKTTLLKTLSGLLRPVQGTCTYNGSPYAFPPPGVSMTFQRGGLFDGMNVEENLGFALKESGVLSRKEFPQKIVNALKDVGLEGTEKKMASELSGGMQKRLVLARALLLNPEILFCDDPTAGLDPVTSRAIIDLLLGAQKKYGMALVWVSSDIPVLLPNIDRAVFLYQGGIRFMGTANELKASTDPVIKQFILGDLEGPLSL